jgi:hypothetical protein
MSVEAVPGSFPKVLKEPPADLEVLPGTLKTALLK